jgi:hypothetical protein
MSAILDVATQYSLLDDMEEMLSATAAVNINH